MKYCTLVFQLILTTSMVFIIFHSPCTMYFKQTYCCLEAAAVWIWVANKYSISTDWSYCGLKECSGSIPHPDEHFFPSVNFNNPLNCFRKSFPGHFIALNVLNVYFVRLLFPICFSSVGTVLNSVYPHSSAVSLYFPALLKRRYPVRKPALASAFCLPCPEFTGSPLVRGDTLQS